MTLFLDFRWYEFIIKAQQMYIDQKVKKVLISTQRQIHFFSWHSKKMILSILLVLVYEQITWLNVEINFLDIVIGIIQWLTHSPSYGMM